MIVLEIELGLNPNVSSSISANFGLPFTNKTELAVEMNENDGTIISSPFPNPYAKRVACNADVAELSVTQ